MPDSVRLQIIEAIRDLYKVAVVDEEGRNLSIVDVGPLGEADARRRYSLGIVPGVERKTHQFPFQMCFLPIATEFRLTANQAEAKPGIAVERLMTYVQMVLYQNKTLGGLAIDVKEVGNEIDLQSYSDRSTYGVVYWEVQYRHTHSDVTGTEGTV